MVSLNCNSSRRARVDQTAREGTPPGLTGGSRNPPALGTSRGHHLASEPGRSLGRTLPCCLPQGQRRDLLTPLLPGKRPSWAPDAAPMALIAKINGHSLTLHLCPLLAGGSPGPETQESGPCSRSHRTRGPEVSSEDSGWSPLSPWGGHCLSTSVAARCQELGMGRPLVVAP